MTDYSAYLKEDKAVLFLLHGVIPEQTHPLRNYTRKHLTADYFDDFLRQLKREGTPVSMDQILEALQGRRELPKKAFGITFDDGFENNLTVAAPILEKHEVPAMFYVTADFIEHNAVSWVDQIEYAVEKVQQVALRNLDATVDGTYGSLEEKRKLMDAIRRLVKSDSSIDPYHFSDKVYEMIEHKPMVLDDFLDRKLSWQQVIDLHEHPLFSVGGHGKTHRILSHLSPPELDEELDVSIDSLSQAIGSELVHFSYPEGLPHCYSDQVIEGLRRRRIACAVTAEEGYVSPGDDCYRLKRVMVI